MRRRGSLPGRREAVMPARVSHLVWLGVWLVSAVAIGAGTPLARAGKQAITLALHWSHQGYFGGYYVADKQGFYAREGLRLGFIEGGPEIDATTPVVEGRAQFGVAPASDVLLARAAGKPVRAFATIFRRCATVYVSKADSGITRPADFVGKTIRITTVDPATFFAMMNRAGIDRDRYRTVIIPSDIRAFASGAADVWAIYVNNFAVILEQAGYKLNYIYPEDYGVHVYGDVLFATDDLIASNPDLVLRFLRATLQGWEIAVEEPALVGSLVRSYAPQADAALETLKMRATQTLVNTGEDRIGWMREDRWAQTAEILREQGALSTPVKLDDVYTLAFLQKIYGAALESH